MLRSERCEHLEAWSTGDADRSEEECMLQRLTLNDMDAAAVVQRRSRDRALPWIAVLHTPEDGFSESTFSRRAKCGAASKVTNSVALSLLKVGSITSTSCRRATSGDWDRVAPDRTRADARIELVDVSAQCRCQTFL